MSKENQKVSILVSPAVIFSIAENYQRRNDSAPARIVGALLGTCRETSDGIVLSARQTFVVPHSEVSNQISINSDYYKQRCELSKKVYGNQLSLIGWFSVTQHGLTISEQNTTFINDSFGREVASSGLPVSAHLNIHISEDGTIKRHCFVTDMNTKTVFSPEKCITAFQSHDLFAATIALDATEKCPEENIVGIEAQDVFISGKMKDLQEGLSKIENMKDENGDIANISKALFSKLGDRSCLLERDIASLHQICDSIKSQMKALEDMSVYQAHC